MDPPRIQLCTNCKKEVPEDNFQLHSVFCSRNLKVCQQCNEPVAIGDMEKHTAQVPCKKCGEVMQACDIPAHKTDACAFTEIQCSYCELQLRRVDMADHELYCGTRTEVCEECSELVMIKYKKLHQESNHTFLKLDDEPGPVPSWKSHASKQNADHTKRNRSRQTFTPLLSQTRTVTFETAEPTNTANQPPPLCAKGAIKKRVAPRPPVKSDQPASTSHSLHRSDILNKIPGYTAMLRAQSEEKKLKEVNAERQINNLPPVLTPAEKYEKLKKLSRLHNPEENHMSNNTHQFDSSVDRSVKQTPKTKSDNASETTSNPRPKNAEARNKKQLEYFEYSPEADSLMPINTDEIATPNHTAQTDKVTNPPPKESLKVKKPKEVPKNADIYNKKGLQYFEFSADSDSLIPVDAENHNVNYANANHSKISDKTKKLNSLQSIVHNANVVRNPKVNNSEKPINSTPINVPKSYNSSPAPTAAPVDRFSGIKKDLQALRKELNECSSPLQMRNALREKNQTAASNPQYNPPSPNHDNVNLYNISNDKKSNVYDSDDDEFPIHIQNDLEGVLLPCEFCEKMIQANQLVAHETGCRPHITSFPDKKDTTPIKNENDRSSFASSIHRNRDLKNEANRNMNKSAKSQRINGDPISIFFDTGLPKQSNVKSNKPKSAENTITDLRTEEMEDFVGSDEVKLPCEFCMSLIPVSQLVWHQEACFDT